MSCLQRNITFTTVMKRYHPKTDQRMFYYIIRKEPNVDFCQSTFPISDVKHWHIRPGDRHNVDEEYSHSAPIQQIQYGGATTPSSHVVHLLQLEKNCHEGLSKTK